MYPFTVEMGRLLFITKIYVQIKQGPERTPDEYTNSEEKNTVGWMSMYCIRGGRIVLKNLPRGTNSSGLCCVIGTLFAMRRFD